MRLRWKWGILGLLVLAAGCNTLPEWFLPLETLSHSWLLKWNRIAVDASGLDHTPLQPGENRVFGHQFGPTRASRAMAIVHIAMFDALNAVAGGYQSYTGIPPAPPNTSMKAAVAQAARDTLVALFPSHAATFDAALAEDLAAISNTAARNRGVQVGQAAAMAILAMRIGDGSDDNTPWVFNNAAGHWRVDPINPTQEPIGPNWGKVRPFVMNRANQFRPPPPAPIDSVEYAAAYNEVKQLGGDGVATPTIRSEDQTFAGIYWAYDGTPSLCAPPRLYNQVAVTIGRRRGLGVVAMGRLLALVNVAMADAGIGIWEAKYHYDYWRPVTGIREADPGTGPSGTGDDNPLTVGDVNWTPLGAPASNLVGPNFTPPFPAYPSGHAGFGGALFQVLREFFGTDNVPFTFVSDEYNGMTRDNAGNIRPFRPRSYATLSQAEEENGQSRIYLGIHWSFDKSEGIAQGRRIGSYVFANAFRPTN